MVVVGGAIPAAPPDGTVQPGLGRGTSLGVGGQTICTFYAERGESPPGSSPGPASSVGFGVARLDSPACSLPRAPRAARMPRRPCAPLSPPALVGPGRRLGCLRAGRRLGGQMSAGRDPCGGWWRAWPWVLVRSSRPAIPSHPARKGVGTAPVGRSANAMAGWVGRRPRTKKTGERGGSLRQSGSH